jgi:hypothetical protein
VRFQIGQAIYIGACALALFVALGGIAANIYLGGGLIPDIGAITMATVVWLAGRSVKALLSLGAAPPGIEDKAKA